MSHTQNSQRAELLGELHARPFPRVDAPCSALFLALRPEGEAHLRDKSEDYAQLRALCEGMTAGSGCEAGTHFQAKLGPYDLRWESHTEFVSYTVFASGDTLSPKEILDSLPKAWREGVKDQIIAAIGFKVIAGKKEPEIQAHIPTAFEPESTTAASVLGGAVTVVADFQIAEDGLTHFEIYPADGCGPQRIGRVLQRLCELETYTTVSLMGLEPARRVLTTASQLGYDLTDLMGRMAQGADSGKAQAHLDEVLALSMQIEALRGQTTFRFGASRAYETIVLNRVKMLEESRFFGRQMFGEFMLRRYDPAMRTIEAAQDQLSGLADRVSRAVQLLRAQVDVERQAQSQAVLVSMDKRASLQLRLQETVEGLSVVAISYYAVGLLKGLTGPFFKAYGVSETMALAILTPLVIGAVWLGLAHARRKLSKS